MSVNTEVQEARDEEDRILEFMRERPEGASYFAVTTELGIARTRAVSILERLHREGRLSFDCKTKLYFSAPERDRLASYERKLDAGEITAPDPELDRASPDRFPAEDRSSNTCRHCGKVVERYLWQHENYCKENPNRKLPPGAGTEAAGDEPETVPCPIEGCKSRLRKNRKAIYGHLYGTTHHLPLPEVHSYLDSILGAGRQRTPQSGPSTPADAVVPGIHPSATEIERRLTEEPPIEKNSGFRINAPSIKEEPVPGPEQPEDTAPIDGKVPPADPLALFAQRHRLRVNKEVRKLRKVERKLRRRAAAAVAMADRVNAARRTKERELRRFEKELGEVRGEGP